MADYHPAVTHHDDSNTELSQNEAPVAALPSTAVKQFASSGGQGTLVDDWVNGNKAGGDSDFIGSSATPAVDEVDLSDCRPNDAYGRSKFVVVDFGDNFLTARRATSGLSRFS